MEGDLCLPGSSCAALAAASGRTAPTWATSLPALIISTIRTREVTSKNQHPARSRADNERVSIPLTNQIDCGIDRLRAVLEVACTRSCASAMLRSPVVVITRACLPDLMRELDRVAADGLGMAALCVGEQRLHGSHRDPEAASTSSRLARSGSQRTSGDRPAARLRSRLAARQTMASCTGGSSLSTHLRGTRFPHGLPAQGVSASGPMALVHDRHRFAPGAPGGGSPARPSLVYSYVLQGEIRSQVEGQPARTFQTGQSWSEPPGSHHMLTENTSASASTRLLVVFVAGAALKTDDR